MMKGKGIWMNWLATMKSVFCVQSSGDEQDNSTDQKACSGRRCFSQGLIQRKRNGHRSKFLSARHLNGPTCVSGSFIGLSILQTASATDDQVLFWLCIDPEDTCT